MNLIEKEKRLSEYEGEDKVISSTEFAEILKNKAEPIIWKTGMSQLDELHEGFEAGELIILAGPTKSGKSTLARTLTSKFAIQDIRVLWFTFEETERQFFRKFPELPVFFLPAQRTSRMLNWVEDKIIESKLKYNTRIVFIDNFDFLQAILEYKERREMAGFIVLELKRIAMEQNIVIFLLMHLKADKQYFREEDIRAGDIRGESGKPIQMADTSLIIWRNKFMDKNAADNTATLKICMTRRSGVAEKTIHLLLWNGQFEEVKQDNDATQETFNDVIGGEK